MSKRIIAILCIVAMMAVSLTACGFGGGKKTTINGVEIEEQQYLSETAQGVFLIMTNKTGNDCDLKITVNFLDNNGNTVDKVENYTERAFAKDTTIVEFFLSDAAYTSLNYDVATEPLSYDQPVDSNLKANISPNGEDITLSVTNNGNVTAEFVEYYVLYYQDGKVVEYDMGYCDDDNNELLPGATVTKEEHCYSQYSNASIYVHGRAKG